MHFDHKAAQTKHGCAAVAGGIEALQRLLEGRLQERRPEFAPQIRHGRALNNGLKRGRRSLDGLQHHIAGKSLRNTDIRLPVQNFARLNATDKIDTGCCLQERIGLLNQRIALLLFEPHIQNGDPGTANSKRSLHVERAHLRKLHQVGGFRIHIGTGIQQEGRAAVLGREQGRERRTLHPRQSSNQYLTADQNRTGIARGYKGIRSLFAYQLHADHQRRILLFAHRNNRRITGLNDLRCRYRFQTLRRIALSRKLLLQDLRFSAEQNLHLGTLLQCLQATLYNFTGRVVAAHRVYCYSHHTFSPLPTYDKA